MNEPSRFIKKILFNILCISNEFITTFYLDLYLQNLFLFAET